MRREADTVARDWLPIHPLPHGRGPVRPLPDGRGSDLGAVALISGTTT